jgi:S-formylglutathione hydrolase FrmB
MKKSIFLLCTLSLAATLQAATVDVLSIPAEKMGSEVSTTLILPDAYAGSTNRFPVLYLLHGAGGDYEAWNAKAPLAELADQYNIIMVCPDGGKTSWYFDSPIDPAFQYETFVAKECVSYIDRHYRTQADRHSRALAGYSMGGHGALFLAIRHRDTFSIAVGISAGTDIRPFPTRWDISKRIGTIEAHPENWEKYSVINVAKELKPNELALALDCGYDDFFIGVNRALHNQLIDAGIAHEYIEKAGKHTWSYWKASLLRQMPFIDAHFRKADTVYTP